MAKYTIFSKNSLIASNTEFSTIVPRHTRLLKPVQNGLPKISQTLLHEKITNIFMIIGIPPHINGYHFLREAIKLAAGNFDMINNITKKLYPLVAQQFNTTPSTVEQGIRNAITVVWNRGKLDNLNIFFGVVVYEKYEKPSNGELIALLAEKIYLDCT